ncbi:MAG: hypothetical protein IT176_09160 [Acidobacteria bacterium]|nr:hypothetical protein [Acidobacteriota bacterium]
MNGMVGESAQTASGEWVAFQGGELEGRRPKALCPSCRQKIQRAAQGRGGRAAHGGSTGSQPLCFQCYRAGLDRDRAIRAAGRLETASEARFQAALPFEPVNAARLAALKAVRAAERTSGRAGAGQFVDRRRRAQIAARHALQRVIAGVAARQAAAPLAPVAGANRARGGSASEGERAIAGAVHAAELQLPEAWVPFVVAR